MCFCLITSLCNKQTPVIYQLYMVQYDIYMFVYMFSLKIIIKVK